MNTKRINDLANLLDRLGKEGVTQDLRNEALSIVANIDPIELSMAEQKLIQDGMEPEKLRHLCDIHMEVLSGELDKVKTKLTSGHVVDTFIAEHEKIIEFLTQLETINFTIQALSNKDENPSVIAQLRKLTLLILDAEHHHLREELVLFPELEQRGITGPTRIMRMEHDELRLRKKQLKEAAEMVDLMDFNDFKATVDEQSKYIIFNLRDHIYKENHILYPTALEHITDSNLWNDMKLRCDDIGYCSFTPNL